MGASTVIQLKHLQVAAYNALLNHAGKCSTDPEYDWGRETRDRRHAMNACLDLREATALMEELAEGIRKLLNGSENRKEAESVLAKYDAIHKPSIRLAENVLGRWIIVNGASDSLAWSGSRWVPHRLGVASGGIQISNFATRDEAHEYALEQFPPESIKQ